MRKNKNEKFIQAPGRPDTIGPMSLCHGTACVTKVRLGLDLASGLVCLYGTDRSNNCVLSGRASPAWLVGLQ
jgi:hypothetical protein